MTPGSPGSAGGVLRNGVKRWAKSRERRQDLIHLWLDLNVFGGVMAASVQVR